MSGTTHLRAAVAACALAIGLGALPSAAPAADVAERHSDLWLKASLVTTYTLNQHLNPFDIDVEVEDGVAILHGRVDTSVEKDLATEVARGIEGIREVDNRLEVTDGASGDKAGSDLMDRVNDANVTAKVKSQLLWNSNTQGMRIGVDTQDGVVSLRGEVASAAESELAERIARNTSGVERVDNQLVVDAGQKPMGEQAEQTALDLQGELNDAWITTKVKASLLYNRGIDAAAIDVQTENRVVSLRGEVRSPYEIERAEQIAADIVGVQRVHNQLHVNGNRGG